MTTTTEKDKVLSLKNDYLFKAVYGSDDENSKSILIALLNKILNRSNNPITDIEYTNPFQAKFYLDDKETILDIKATTNTMEIIDIEMQIVWQDDMPERLVYYHGGLIRSALKKGEPYKNIKPTITICITNSVAFPDTENYISEFYVQEENKHFKLTNVTKICCIELPKVNPKKKPLDELTPLEVCLEYLRCADEHKSEYVAELIRRGGKELEMAQEKLTKFTQDEIMREQALAREKYQHDMLSWKYALEEAAENLKKTQQEMLKTEKRMLESEKKVAESEKKVAETDKRIREIAKKLISAGYSREEAADFTGLPINEVAKLR